MKLPCSALFLPVLSLLCITNCPAQQTAMLANAPLPNVASDAQPGDAFSSSAMGVFPVEAPQTQEKKPRLNPLDWSLLGASATLRVLDFTSTEKALTQPQYYHEAMLPQGLVKNKPAFAAFQAGTVALNFEAYRYLVRYNRRPLARVAQFAYVGAMSLQIAHNYQVLGQKPPQ